MKKIIVFVFFIVCCVSFPFANEKQVDTSEISFVQDYEDGEIEVDFLKKTTQSVSRTFIGGFFLGMSGVHITGVLSLIISLGCALGPVYGPKIVGGLFTGLGFGIAGPPAVIMMYIWLGVIAALSAVGGSQLGIGVSRLKEFYPNLTEDEKLILINKKMKRYKIGGIVSSVLSGVALAVFGSGFSMTIPGFTVTPSSGLQLGGLMMNVLGGIGVSVAVPMMIMNLSLYSWLKGQLPSVTPELSFTHDSKKDITEGYSVRMGLRVRI